MITGCNVHERRGFHPGCDLEGEFAKFGRCLKSGRCLHTRQSAPTRIIVAAERGLPAWNPSTARIEDTRRLQHRPVGA